MAVLKDLFKEEVKNVHVLTKKNERRTFFLLVEIFSPSPSRIVDSINTRPAIPLNLGCLS